MRRVTILLLCVSVLAACGGGGKPAIAPATAKRLAAQADAIAAGVADGDACAAARHATALQAATIRAINAHAIPLRYQEALQSRANELVSELQAACLPSMAAAPTTTVAPPRPVPPGHGPKPGRGHDDHPKKPHGHHDPHGKRH